MPAKRNQNKIGQQISPNVQSEFAETQKQPFPHKPKSAGIWSVLSLVFLLAALALGFLYFKQSSEYKKLKADLAATNEQLKSSSQSSSTSSPLSEENQALLKAVGRLLILPTDEQPTIATVADLSKLKGQAFFANAKLGDKVLIYTNAKKAILYRPSEDKIIELAPLNIGSSTAASSKLKVEIRNGSGVSGAATTFKNKLNANSFNVVKVGNAKTIYPKTILYVLGGSQDQISSLQQISGAEIVSSLPAGEAASTADAVLILGQQ